MLDKDLHEVFANQATLRIYIRDQLICTFQNDLRVFHFSLQTMSCSSQCFAVGSCYGWVGTGRAVGMYICPARGYWSSEWLCAECVTWTGEIAHPGAVGLLPSSPADTRRTGVWNVYLK